MCPLLWSVDRVSSHELSCQNRIFGGRLSQRDSGCMEIIDVCYIVSPGYPFAHIPIHRISLIISSNITQPYHISQIHSFLKAAASYWTQKEGHRAFILWILNPRLHPISMTCSVSVHTGPNFQQPAPAAFCLWVFFGHWRCLWSFLRQEVPESYHFLGTIPQPRTK